MWSKRQVGPLGPGVEGRKSPLFALGLEEFKSRRQITMRNPSGMARAAVRQVNQVRLMKGPVAPPGRSQGQVHLGT